MNICREGVYWNIPEKTGKDEDRKKPHTNVDVECLLSPDETRTRPGAALSISESPRTFEGNKGVYSHKRA